MKECRLETPRGDVSYWISRAPRQDARCLFFLHGLTADHRLFSGQFPHFEGNYHLIAWDAPLHGKSRPYEQGSYGNGAQDIDAILSAEGFGQAVFIGQSMGGYHAQALLLQNPERVEAFIGIDTCPFGEGYYSRSDCWWLRQVEWMSCCYPYPVLVRAIAASCACTDEARQGMLQMLRQYPKRELCHLMGVGFAGFLEENRPLEIPCPVLLLVGEKDRTGKVRQYSEAWHRRCGYPLLVVPGAAHNANADQPDFVNRAIDNFLTAL